MISRKWPFLRSALALVAMAGTEFAQAATGTPAPASPPPALAAPATPVIRQIIVTDSIEAAQQQNALPDRGYVVVQPSVPFLDEKELARRLAAGEGRPAEERLLAGIALVIETYAREKDFPIASAIIPPQNMAGGTVRVALLRGKIRDIKVPNARWFSQSLLREKLRLERGEAVKVSELDRAINWTNSNPFRRVRVHIQPVDAGEADIIIGIEERMPLRLTASYDNTGNEILGENRYTAGVTYGNVWGLDHQASYQFVTSDDIGIFRAHAFDYRIPLRWRHVLNFSGSYVLASPTFFDGYFTQKGESINAEAKYIIPFRHQRWRGELSGAVAFKETNNNLEFGGTPQLSATIHVLTGTFAAVAIREDKRGHWLTSTTLVGSAGDFNSRSTRDRFDTSRLGANPNFYYGQASGQRTTHLTPRLTSTARGLFQLASTNLVPTEQFSLGGLSTVRGYEERILSGDAGYSLTHELQVRLNPVTLNQRLPKMDWAGLFFADYGRVIQKSPVRGQRKSDFLLSAGVGLRASVGQYFSASLDYARQIEKVELPGASHDRIHVRATISY